MKTSNPNCRRPAWFTRLTLTVLLLGFGAAQTLAATHTWLGAGADDNWSTPENWDIGAPTFDADVIFGDTDPTGTSGPSGTPNNIVAVDQAIQSLTYKNLTGFHTTQIPLGTNLTISGAVSPVVFVGTGADNGSSQTVYATVIGGGALVVSNSAGVINVRQGSPTSGPHRATFDLSGLDTFNCLVNQILVAGDGSSAAARVRPSGTLLLAKTNFLTLTSTTSGNSLILGNTSNNGNSLTYGEMGILQLGQTNVILSDSGMIVGGIKGTALLVFNSSMPDPKVVFRDLTGTGRQGSWYIGNNNAATANNSTIGTVDLTGGTVDALVGTIYVGRGQQYPVGTGLTTGNLAISKGVIDATTLEIGIRRMDYGGQARGNVTVGNTAQLIVGGNLRIGYSGITAPTNLPCSGTLNITNGGLVWVKGRIIDGGPATNVINIAGGYLKLGGQLGRDVDALERPLDDLNVTNGTLTLTLNSTINAANPICGVTNLTLATAATINVQGGGFTLGQYPLIKYYSGIIGGDGYGVLALGTLPSRTTGHLSNNTDNSSIDLVVTGISSAKWDGTVNSDWDIDTTTNWVDALTSAATTYLESAVPGDSVVFDDTASGTTMVNLTTTLSPVLVTLANTNKTYVFNGPGSLSGTTPLVKSGGGLVILTNSGVNDFSGAITINGGTLRLGLAANRLPTVASVALEDVSGATLDLGGVDQTVSVLSGGGPNGGNVDLGAGVLTTMASGTYYGSVQGTGMFRKTGSGTQTLGGASSYSGGTYIAGTVTLINTNGSGLGSGLVEIASGTLNIGNGGLGGSLDPAAVITNNGTVVFNRSNDFTFANVLQGGGSVTKQNTNTVLVTAANTYTNTTTISDGALRINNGAALGDPAGATTIPNTPGAHLELLGDITVAEVLTISQKQSAYGLIPSVVNLSGTNTLSGQINGNAGGSYWPFRSDAGKLIVSGYFVNNTTSGSRLLRLFGVGEGDWATTLPAAAGATTHVLKEEGGTWTLSGINTYDGETRAYGGLLMVSGQIQSPANVIVGDPATNTPARLGGTGLIFSPVIVNPNGTLAPGASIGTLTIYNALTLSGTTEMEVSPLDADKLTGLTAITYGGTLKVLLSGTLTGTEVFTLFESPPGTYSGSFAAYDLPTLPFPMMWNMDTLATDGKLRVSIGGTKPQIATVSRAVDGNIQLGGTGPNGAAYRVLSSTNAALPLTSWMEIGNGTFTGGTFSFLDPNATNYVQRFYSVVTP
jgi:fibronectin-binding autotransporter adhesin